MNLSSFRGTMLARILRVTGSVGLGLGAAQACSRSPLELPIERAGVEGRGGQTTSNATGSPSSNAVVGPSSNGAGGFTFDTSAEASTSTGIQEVDAGGTCTTDVDGGVPEIACVSFSTPPSPLCPSPDGAASEVQQLLGPCFALVEICGGPFGQDQGHCCYDIEEVVASCYVGRTFYLDEGTLLAELREGDGWSADLAPDVRGLSPETRRALSDAWARDGLFEHASVASFSRFAMQLLAVGAPADLVRDVHAGAIDEVHHAEICLALASAYAGRRLEPTALPLPNAVALDADLASVAAETAMEGCIGETGAAVQAYDALRRATDPAVIAVLETTVADETRHAEIGWRFVAWALERGGEATRKAVVRAFASFRPAPPRAEDYSGVSLADYVAHGRQTAVDARAIADRTLREVVGPAVCALLERTPRVGSRASSTAGGGVAHSSLESNSIEA